MIALQQLRQFVGIHVIGRRGFLECRRWIRRCRNGLFELPQLLPLLLRQGQGPRRVILVGRPGGFHSFLLCGGDFWKYA